MAECAFAPKPAVRAQPIADIRALETKIAALAAKVEIMPRLIFAMAFAIVPGVIAVPDAAHAACKVEGVWEQVSLTWDGHARRLALKLQPSDLKR